MRCGSRALGAAASATRLLSCAFSARDWRACCTRRIARAAGLRASRPAAVACWRVRVRGSSPRDSGALGPARANDAPSCDEMALLQHPPCRASAVPRVGPRRQGLRSGFATKQEQGQLVSNNVALRALAPPQARAAARDGGMGAHRAKPAAPRRAALLRFAIAGLVCLACAPPVAGRGAAARSAASSSGGSSAGGSSSAVIVGELTALQDTSPLAQAAAAKVTAAAAAVLGGLSLRCAGVYRAPCGLPLPRAAAAWPHRGPVKQPANP